MSNPYYHIQARSGRPTADQVKTCTLCGAVAVCYVGVAGYCKVHRAVAVKVLARENATIDHAKTIAFGRGTSDTLVRSREALRSCKRKHR
jgi:hypothetical protein